MSPRIGPLNLTEPGDGAIQPGSVSPETAGLADEEERRIVNECYQDAIRLLQENRARLDGLTEAVLKKDTLDQDEIYAIAGISKPGNRARLAPALPPDGAGRDKELASLETER
jgi:cell division protease FtsH